MNSLSAYHSLFDEFEPWTGHVPSGFLVDLLGTLTDVRFRPTTKLKPEDVGGGMVATKLPTMGNGENAEWWFETVNWLLAARDACGHFVMITLGAHYGAQAVGAFRALRMLNPMRCTLVAVEPEPDNFLWMQQHFRDNGLDPEDHWLIPMAVSNDNEPVFFPVGAPGVGANNSFASNEPSARRAYAREIIDANQSAEALRNLLVNNSSGIIRPVHPGLEEMTEIKCVSAVTLRDLVDPFETVDYIEADIQQSEILVFPPFMDVLRAKVRRIHIGTHGIDNHRTLYELFERHGWTIDFAFEPNADHQTDLGLIKLNDGVLSVHNPDLSTEP